MEKRAKRLLDGVDDLMIALIAHGINKDPKFQAAVAEVSHARNWFFKEVRNQPEEVVPVILSRGNVMPEPVTKRPLHDMEKITFLDEVVDMVNGGDPNV